MSPEFFNDQDLTPIFLRLPPEHIAEFKFLLESYDELGILRTLNPERGEVVILAIPDSLATLHELLGTLKEELNLEIIPPPPSLETDWLVKGSVEK